MKPFIFDHWHAWESNDKIMLSDESIKSLMIFDDIDLCINWLYFGGNDKTAARELNKHK